MAFAEGSWLKIMCVLSLYLSLGTFLRKMPLDSLLLVNVRSGVHDFLEGVDEAVAAFVANLFSNGRNG